MLEMWSKPEHQLTYRVAVSGLDACVEVPQRTPLGPGFQAFLLHQVDVRWEWSDPNEDLVSPFVTLHTASVITGKPNGGKLYLGQLRETPDWLSNLIQRTMPRL